MHNDKKYFSTGDSDQLAPFGFYFNNVKDINKYLKICNSIMFPNKIILQENKRLCTDEDKEKLATLKDEIFDLSKDVMSVLKKYFKTINKYSQLETIKNISFFNFRSEVVNKIVHKKIKNTLKSVCVNGIDYYENLELICNRLICTIQHLKNKHQRMRNEIKILMRTNELLTQQIEGLEEIISPS